MSGALTIGVAAGAQLLGLFKQPQRRIGPIIPGIVIEENHTDELEVTDHPVEQGASISDHAFKLPAEVTIECRWSNTQAALYDFSESYVNGVYAQLLQLQASRTLISIVTGKRLYANMLIKSIATQTNKQSAYALPVMLTCKEIIVVQTAATTVPPQDQHALPQQTAPIISNGQQSLQSSQSESSALSSLQALGVNVQGFSQ